ncbi:hypothetical protein BDF20DRAFT_855501 [Mycotypha africana]|uniref:uncharacterized protein n=1 Tax=Mycotypha africana TaxID=64632 RepID=UPI0023013A11|nr:uncharacterized protein BDF20DRAFT_855501 [Mycotypha africana]KAI8988399.1 hypothetical protein BDF20DRAFT_855501 [Mycotypha africana]
MTFRSTAATTTVNITKAATTTMAITPTKLPIDYRCYRCKIVCKKGDPNVIRAVGNIYHRQCFRCDVCNQH